MEYQAHFFSGLRPPAIRHLSVACSGLRHAIFRLMRSKYSYLPPRGKTVPGATDFLRRSGTMAALMPAVTRMMALQKDCAQALPTMFSHCDIVQFQEGQLVLAIPNAALAAKLKQQLPKLQTELEKRGWHIAAIKLKVQVTKSLAPVVLMRSLELPNRAVSAFAELGETLPDSPQHKSLIAALRAMVARRRQE